MKVGGAEAESARKCREREVGLGACLDILDRRLDGRVPILPLLGGALTVAEQKIEKLVRKPLDGLKVLGNGELTKKLTVKATVFSATAKEKIEAAGGKTEEV